MVAPIKEFPKDGAPWRIDALGALSLAPTGEKQFYIEIHLSELAKGSRNPLLKAALASPARHMTVSVHGDQIALFPQGSVWVNGIRLPPNQSPETREFRLNARDFSFIRFDGNVQIDGVPHKLITPTRYQMGDEALKRTAGAWLAVVYNPKPGVEFVAIPCAAIFQRCAVTSSAAAHRLIFGEIDKIVDPSSGHLSDDKKTFFAELFNDFYDHEAAPIASLLVDPIGRREYARLRRSIVSENVNAGGNRAGTVPGAHLSFGLPFTNDVTLTVSGKSMAFNIPGRHQDQRWGFLATEITQLKTKLVFDRIVVARKMGRGMKEGDEYADSPYTPRAKAEIELNAVRQLSSAVTPSHDFEPVKANAAGGFIAENLIIISQKSEADKFRKRPRKPIDAAAFKGDVATGDAHSRSNGVARMKLVGTRAPATPVTLLLFHQTLDLLAADGYRFTTLAVSETSSKFGSHLTSYFPDSIQGCRSWHLMSQQDGKTTPRAFVFAQLKLGGVWHYLIELERKKTPIALLHIRSHDGREIPSNQVLIYMIAVARYGGWLPNDNYRQWAFTRINHPASNEAVDLKRRIITHALFGV